MTKYYFWLCMIFTVAVVGRRCTADFDFSVEEDEVDNDVEDELVTPDLRDDNEEANDIEAHSVLDTIEKVNEETDGSFSQIDVKRNPRSKSSDEYEGQGSYKRNAVRDNNLLWHTRAIPYFFHKSLTSQKKTVILEAMKSISTNSCISFHPKVTTKKAFLNITSDTGCWSYIGRVGNFGQELSIGDGCEYIGIVQHELIHALGFHHEQSRYDRDRFVEVKWENIIPGYEDNFKKETHLTTRNLGTGYDYRSIMHYSKTAFSKNGKPTIEVIGKPIAKLGDHSVLSQDDIVSLNRLYHCYSTKKLSDKQWSQWSDFGLCHLLSADVKKPCYKRRYRFCHTPSMCKCEMRSDGRTTCNEDQAKCTDAECKLDGHWSHWSLWSVCSSTTHCTKGVKTRARTCSNPLPRKGGKSCPGNGTDSMVCEGICPRDCTFNEGNWCGLTHTGQWRLHVGKTPTTRTGPMTDVSGEGKYAYTETSRSAPHIVSKLTSIQFRGNPQKGGMAQRFSMFYHMYGRDIGNLTVYLLQNGTATRKALWVKKGDQGNVWKNISFDIASTKPFQIQIEAISGKSYRGDIALDNIRLSVTNGFWTKWGAWSECSATAHCTKGVRTRERSCTNPFAKQGGKLCVGASTQSTPCKVVCPDGFWTKWGAWSKCSATAHCTKGVRTRERSCTNPFAKQGGKPCVGASTQSTPCEVVCPDGFWTKWGAWSECSATAHCMKGVRTRERSCTNPFAKQGGKPCVGASTQSTPCKVVCPDGFWTKWGAWLECSATAHCTKGVRTRERSCTNPFAKQGGKPCVGASTQSTPCKVVCPDGFWTKWGAWSECSATAHCTKGVRTRERSCTNPFAKQGGKPCVGASTQSTPCKVVCPDGFWTEWGAWSECSATGYCTRGVRTSERSCTNPFAKQGGKPCGGASTQSTPCKVVCPRICTFTGDWCGYKTTGQWKMHVAEQSTTGKVGGGYTGSGSGKTMFAFAQGVTPSLRSVLTSPMFMGSDTSECFSISYNMQDGNLTVYSIEGPTRVELWSVQGPQGSGWRNVSFDIFKISPFRLEIEAITGLKGGSIAVDDVTLSKTSCDGIRWESTAVSSTQISRMNVVMATLLSYMLLHLLK